MPGLSLWAGLSCLLRLEWLPTGAVPQCMESGGKEWLQHWVTEARSLPHHPQLSRIIPKGTATLYSGPPPTPSLWIHFPWFRLPVVNHVLEADGPSSDIIILSIVA